MIQGPLGIEEEFREMNAGGDYQDIKVIADVVLNHTIDVKEMPEPEFVKFNGDDIMSEEFARFEPGDFHRWCNIHEEDRNSEQTCWLSDTLCDLRMENLLVCSITKDYLRKLGVRSVDGFRFEAAKYIEPDFFGAMLQAVPHTYAFGEVITRAPDSILQVDALNFYDFPPVVTIKQAFGLGQTLACLKIRPTRRVRCAGRRRLLHA